MKQFTVYYREEIDKFIFGVFDLSGYRVAFVCLHYASEDPSLTIYQFIANFLVGSDVEITTHKLGKDQEIPLSLK